MEKRPEPKYRTYKCEIGMTAQEEAIVREMKRAIDEEAFLAPIKRILEEEYVKEQNNRKSK